MLSQFWPGHGKSAAAQPPQPPEPTNRYPTLDFSRSSAVHFEPQSVCSRCLTLLSHVLTHFGDGTDYAGLEIIHSSAIEDISDQVWHSTTSSSEKARTNTTRRAFTKSPCIICIRAFIQFEAARAHVSFEKTLRSTPPKEWSLIWEIHTPTNQYAQLALPHHQLRVAFGIKHTGGYGWGAGGFKVYPDSKYNPKQTSDNEIAPENPVITDLDPRISQNETENAETALDFSSTLSTGTISLVSTWASECMRTHTKCNNIFGGIDQAPGAAGWFPDRLLRITKTDASEVFESGQMSSDVSVRLVLKADSEDFSAEQTASGLIYLSLSHCWGRAPSNTAPLGGRANSMLTEDKLAAWRKDLPYRDLPNTFQHAIAICAMLGCEHIWIDSLCIIQDSLDDWRAQSALMGDVYKYAWLNIAALWSESDFDGFINDSRDPRVVFGFRTQFAPLLEPHSTMQNAAGQDCILLRGTAKLLWERSFDAPGMGTFNAPLFQRAWVYQEKNLARRTIGFTKMGIHWACDVSARDEMSTESDAASWNGLRATQHLVDDFSRQIFRDVRQEIPAPMPSADMQRLLKQLCEAFSGQWHSAVTAYTLCKLTMHTDKLMAISSIAREMGNIPVLGKMRYLAGLWSLNFIFQLGWITVEGDKTAARKLMGEPDYVAPSWTWASIDAPVQPKGLLHPPQNNIALAEARDADVALTTDFVFGTVNGAWVRMWGRLRRVKSGKRKPYYSYDPSSMVNSLTDLATGQDLWFSSDTVEGIELIVQGKNINELLWMPLTLRYAAGAIGCTALVLLEVKLRQHADPEGRFVKPGEKTYRRLGTGDFGIIPSKLREHSLLRSLGTFPDAALQSGAADALISGFQKSTDGFEEFVLV